ncbi:MAG: radical SAM protein [Candidatus Bathyarchaeota archaeon]|nr:MAG: radical SAM protein [Candidatus Bathyarchaeota archaeon]
MGEQGNTISQTVCDMENLLHKKEVISYIDDLIQKGVIQKSLEKNVKLPILKPTGKLDTIWIEITSRCNLKCVHCYADADSPQIGEELSKKTIFSVIDDAAEMNCRKIQFTGGEPTMRADLIELIEYAKSRVDIVEIFTNGTLLNEDQIKFFAENEVHVAFSIYSYRPDTHDSITQVKSSFDKMLGNLKLLLAYNVRVFGAAVAMKQNEKELDDTIQFLSKLGVLTRLPDPIRPTGRGINQRFWPKDYSLLLLRSEPDFVVNKQVYEKNLFWNSCWMGKVTVTSAGDVLPCNFGREQVVGNVHDERLKDLINNEKMKYFWELTMDKIEVCKDCEYRYICPDCRPWAFGFTGKLTAKSPRCTYDPYTGEWAPPENSELYTNTQT